MTKHTFYQTVLKCSVDLAEKRTVEKLIPKAVSFHGGF